MTAAAQVPDLPFRDGQFDLVLCSHFLFTYSELLSTELHLACLMEMLRVAREVRVFPILDMDGGTSPHVAPVLAALAEGGFQARLVRVPYEYQRGGHTMLAVGQ